MLTEAEQEEVLHAIGFSHVKASLHPSIRPAISSPTVRAQMTDWLFQHDSVDLSQDTPACRYIMVECGTHYGTGGTIAEALARCVLEVTRA